MCEERLSVLMWESGKFSIFYFVRFFLSLEKWKMKQFTHSNHAYIYVVCLDICICARRNNLKVQLKNKKKKYFGVNQKFPSNSDVM